ncbi:MAG: tRNA (adenosine(37)-N6)-dimethylallyltransferase MiaA [Ignavibacteria bacterium]
MEKKNCLAIVGPTGSGKTELSYRICELMDCEIVSADSRQVYKGISIATSAPGEEYLKKYKHYFVGYLSLDEDFNAGEFGRQGRIVVLDILKRNKVPLIVGGSGLYIRFLIDGFFQKDAKDIEVRKQLYTELELYGKEYLYQKLKLVDPETADKMSPQFFRRVIRALEVYFVTGEKMSDLQKENVKLDFVTIQYGLNYERKILYERINQRVEQMIKNGLIEEVKILMQQGYHYKTHNSLNTVGVKEVFQFLEGELSYEDMVNLIKQNSRHYAKRQLTWFRKDSRINWIEVGGEVDFDIIAKKIVREFETRKE